MHPCAPRFTSELTVPQLGLVEIEWDEDDNMPLVYHVTSCEGAIRWVYPGDCYQPIEEHMCETGFYDEFMHEFHAEACGFDNVSIGFMSSGPEPGGTPISELSGRPGHPGYDEWLRISRSWGYD